MPLRGGRSCGAQVGGGHTLRTPQATPTGHGRGGCQPLSRQQTGGTRRSCCGDQARGNVAGTSGRRHTDATDAPATTAGRGRPEWAGPAPRAQNPRARGCDGDTGLEMGRLGQATSEKRSAVPHRRAGILHLTTGGKRVGGRQGKGPGPAKLGRAGRPLGNGPPRVLCDLSLRSHKALPGGFPNPSGLSLPPADRAGQSPCVCHRCCGPRPTAGSTAPGTAGQACAVGGPPPAVRRARAVTDADGRTRTLNLEDGLATPRPQLGREDAPENTRPGPPEARGGQGLRLRTARGPGAPAGAAAPCRPQSREPGAVAWCQDSRRRRGAPPWPCWRPPQRPGVVPEMRVLGGRAGRERAGRKRAPWHRRLTCTRWAPR